MTLFKFGLITLGILGFASFVYYRVQTIPQPPQLEISFGRANAGPFTGPQKLEPGKKYIKGKITHGPMKEDEFDK